MRLKNVRVKLLLSMIFGSLLVPLAVFASEADLAIPDLHKGAPVYPAGRHKTMGSSVLWRVHHCGHARYQFVSAPPGQEVESP